ncbi:MAG: ATP-dependent helicase [Puniceicoccales bacterium]|jgi:DNA helicase-2/ATP-dependent DNA helicase PcrA|nr:ATP-dependent helicase [Puniceicoccales bacterium]
MPSSNATAIPPIDFARELNEDQYRAVITPPGPTLVLAGAGSGKTRTLTYRVAWLLTQGVRPHEILLLTFTNKAAKEMLARVESLTGHPQNHFWGGTFHSIGLRLIRSNAVKAGLSQNFTILDTGEAESLFTQAVQRISPAFFKSKGMPRPHSILDAISYARNTLRPLDGVLAERYYWLNDEQRAQILPLADVYKKARRQNATCDYDDLLELWLQLLQNNPDVLAVCQQRFKHILVDEYQDTNPLQGTLIEALAARHHQLMAVGDDAQCIYTWRGANPEHITQFPARHPGATIHKIEINYRSTPQILAFANHILEAHHHDNPSLAKTLRASRADGPLPRVIPTMNPDEQARYIIHRIRELHHDDGRALSDITILYRAHYQAMELQMELTRNQIPYVITSGIRFFDQAHIRDLIAHLRIIHNPNDTPACARLLTQLPKVGPKTVQRLLGRALQESGDTGRHLVEILGTEKLIATLPAPARDSGRELTRTLLQMLHALHGDGTAAAAAATHATPAHALQIALNGWYGDHLRTQYDNWQDRRDDLNSLIAHASPYTDIDELLSQLSLLTTESEPSATAANPGYQDALRLTTVHQAKGLEYPVVFIIGCAEELFPLKRAIESGDIAEERRLFYVAATRAKDELYCTVPKLSKSGGSMHLLETTRFIGELPPDTYKLVHVRNLRD